MSLDWNATKVADLDRLHLKDGEGTKTAYLAYELMAVCVSGITEANWLDVWTRIDIIQKLRGALLLTGDGKPSPYTAEDIQRRIGYSTNVGNQAFSKVLARHYEVAQGNNKRAYNK